MSLTIYLYLIDLLKNLDTTLSIIIFLYLLVLGIAFSAWCMTHDSYNEDDHNYIEIGIKKLFHYSWIFFIALTISILIPSDKTMYLMLGNTYLQSTNLPVKVSQALELKLDSVIEDLKIANKKESK